MDYLVSELGVVGVEMTARLHRCWVFGPPRASLLSRLNGSRRARQIAGAGDVIHALNRSLVNKCREFAHRFGESRAEAPLSYKLSEMEDSVRHAPNGLISHHQPV